MSFNSTAQRAFAQLPRITRSLSKFNRSYVKKIDNEVDKLIPFMALHIQPGDIVDLSMNVFERILNLKHPPMDGLKEKFFFFWVPYRIIWDHWQEFYFAVDLAQRYDFDPESLTLPKVRTKPRLHSIIDYFGRCPISNQDGGNCSQPTTIDALQLRAYNKVWNEWFRAENIQDVVIENRGDDGTDELADYQLKTIGKDLDLFTSCLPWAQKGDAVELPIGGLVEIQAKNDSQKMPIMGTGLTDDSTPINFRVAAANGNVINLGLGILRESVPKNSGTGNLMFQEFQGNSNTSAMIRKDWLQNASTQRTYTENGGLFWGDEAINSELANLKLVATQTQPKAGDAAQRREIIWDAWVHSNNGQSLIADRRTGYCNLSNAPDVLYGRPLTHWTEIQDSAGDVPNKYSMLIRGSGLNKLENSGEWVTAAQNNRSALTQDQGLLALSPRFSSDTKLGEFKASDMANMLQGNLNNATSITVNDFRQLVLQQRFQEALARAGTGRIEEVLYAIWGVDIGLSTVQRSEYLGGFTADWMFQTIAQTSESTANSPQGNLSSQAILKKDAFCFRKAFKEHGVVIGIKCTKGDLAYCQGNSWENIRRTAFDLYNPMFAGSGEQPIYTDEIYCTGEEPEEIEQKEIFGYNEFGSRERYLTSDVSGDFRPLKAGGSMKGNMAFWTFTQYFEDKPVLSDLFMQQKTPIERVLVNENDRYPIAGLLYLNLKHYRQVSVYSTPGIDKL